MYALYAAAFATFSTIIHKKLLYKEHALEFITILSISNFIFTLPFLYKSDFNFSFYVLLIIIFISLINSLGAYYLTKAFRHLEISIASPLMGFEPGFVVLLSFLFLKEGITYSQMWGLILTLIGGYLLEVRWGFSLLQPIREAIKSKYIHYGLLAILIYSFSAIISRYIVNTNNNFSLNIYTYLILVHFFVSIILFFSLMLKYDGIYGIKNGIKNMGWLLLPSSFFSVAHGFFTLFAISLPEANVGLVLAIKRISIFFETLIGGELFHDPNLFMKVIASVIIILGVYLVI